MTLLLNGDMHSSRITLIRVIVELRYQGVLCYARYFSTWLHVSATSCSHFQALSNFLGYLSQSKDNLRYNCIILPRLLRSFTITRLYIPQTSCISVTSINWIF